METALTEPPTVVYRRNGSGSGPFILLGGVPDNVQLVVTCFKKAATSKGQSSPLAA